MHSKALHFIDLLTTHFCPSNQIHNFTFGDVIFKTNTEVGILPLYAISVDALDSPLVRWNEQEVELNFISNKSTVVYESACSHVSVFTKTEYRQILSGISFTIRCFRSGEIAFPDDVFADTLSVIVKANQLNAKALFPLKPEICYCHEYACQMVN